MTRKSDPDGWYDPDGTDAAMLRQIREAGEYRRSDPPPKTGESVGGMDVPPASTSSSLSASGTSPGLSPLRHAEESVRIAELKAALDDQYKRAESYLAGMQATVASARQMERDTAAARIAELEAERDKLRGELALVRLAYASVITDRDRLKAASHER